MPIPGWRNKPIPGNPNHPSLSAMRLLLHRGSLAYITRGRFAGRVVTLTELAPLSVVARFALNGPCWIVDCASLLSGLSADNVERQSKKGLVQANHLAVIGGPAFNWLIYVKEERKS